MSSTFTVPAASTITTPTATATSRATSTSTSTAATSNSRIPIALQAVFLASNRGNDVHVAPPDKIASKLYFRNWLFNTTSSSSSNNNNKNSSPSTKNTNTNNNNNNNNTYSRSNRSWLNNNYYYNKDNSNNKKKNTANNVTTSTTSGKKQNNTNNTTSTNNNSLFSRFSTHGSTSSTHGSTGSTATNTNTNTSNRDDTTTTASDETIVLERSNHNNNDKHNSNYSNHKSRFLSSHTSNNNNNNNNNKKLASTKIKASNTSTIATTTSGNKKKTPIDTTNVTNSPTSKTKIVPTIKLHSINPQLFLDDLIRHRGYSTIRYKTLDSGYYYKPDELQLSSYDVYIIQLAKRIASCSNDITTTTYKNDLQEFNNILSCGISVNPCNVYSESLFHTICRYSNVQLVYNMIQNGTDVYVSDDYGRIPLHDTCWSANTNTTNIFTVVQLLVSTPLYIQSSLLPSTDNTNTTTNNTILKYTNEGHTMFYMADCRGYVPLQYVTKDYWTIWNEFIYTMKDIYWPIRNRIVDGNEQIPILTTISPNIRNCNIHIQLSHQLQLQQQLYQQLNCIDTTNAVATTITTDDTNANANANATQQQCINKKNPPLDVTIAQMVVSGRIKPEEAIILQLEQDDENDEEDDDDSYTTGSSSEEEDSNDDDNSEENDNEIDNNNTKNVVTTVKNQKDNIEVVSNDDDEGTDDEDSDDDDDDDTDDDSYFNEEEMKDLMKYAATHLERRS